MAKRKKNNIVLYFVFTFLLVIVDLATKTFFTGKKYFEDSFFFISSSQNTGSAFGLFASFETYNLIIIILSILIMIGFFFTIKKATATKEFLIASVLFTSGLLGNLYDRIVFGYVRDFIGIKYFSIFNLADVYLTLTFIVLVLHEVSENKLLKTKN